MGDAAERPNRLAKGTGRLAVELWGRAQPPNGPQLVHNYKGVVQIKCECAKPLKYRTMTLFT